jgi:radical SAM protein with 4Fe4S-binding SPASM domain
MIQPLRRIFSYIIFILSWRFNFLPNLLLPLEVSVEITNQCNFKCSFCPQCSAHHFDKVGRHSLNTDDATAILSEIREFGYWDNRIHWTLDGEPFVNNQFEKICVIALELGFNNQHFASNCMLLTKKRAQALPRDVNFTLTVDFCADQDYFEKYRGTQGSWQIIRDNITTIITDQTFQNIRFAVTDISTYRIDDSIILKDNLNKLRQLFPRSNRIKFLSKSFNNSTGFVKKNIVMGKYHLCPYPWSSLVIASNGDVVACCRDLEHKTVLGNILKGNGKLHEVWTGFAFMKMRENLRLKLLEENEACRFCDLPYDDKKHSMVNIIKTIFNRLQILRYA